MAEVQTFDPSVSNFRNFIGDRSGQLVVIHIQEPELDPSQADIFGNCAGELISAKVGKLIFSESKVGNRSRELVRIQIQVFYIVR